MSNSSIKKDKIGWISDTKGYLPKLNEAIQQKVVLCNSIIENRRMFILHRFHLKKSSYLIRFSPGHRYDLNPDNMLPNIYLLLLLIGAKVLSARIDYIQFNEESRSTR